jgi:hypothetical protein
MNKVAAVPVEPESLFNTLDDWIMKYDLEPKKIFLFPSTKTRVSKQ